MRFLFGLMLTCVSFSALGMSYYLIDKDLKAAHGDKDGTVREFAIADAQCGTDLQGKGVLIPASGQVWAFNPDQTIQFTSIEKRVASDNAVVVYGNLKATAQIKQRPQQTLPVLGTPAPPADVTEASLDGVVKLCYEAAGQSWYLVSVDPVAVKVTNK